MKVKVLVFCRDCKNFVCEGYCEGEEVTNCELGRYHEHTTAENNHWLCECEYWEAKH